MVAVKQSSVNLDQIQFHVKAVIRGTAIERALYIVKPLNGVLEYPLR